MEKYPYFIHPLLLQLRRLQEEKARRPLSEEERQRERKICELLAANVGDDRVLMELTGDFDFRNFYPKEKRKPDTDVTIASFLDRYGAGAGMPAPDSPLFVEPLDVPGNDASDEIIAEEIPEEMPEEEPEAKEFPEKEPEEDPEDEESPEEEPEVDLEDEDEIEEVSEDEEEAEEEENEENHLEKIKQLVKNREYGAALEIMEAIYLNNPKKSVYFADQIRFIKKMMLNESKK